MEFLNDRRVITEISRELDMSPILVDRAVSSFFSNIAKEIGNTKDYIGRGEELVIEVKHLGKFRTKKNLKDAGRGK